MFKNMKLSNKIRLGFSSILIIAVVLGLVAIANMTRSGSNAKKLDNDYVPAVSITGEFLKSLNVIILNIRSYGLSENSNYYDNYVKESENANKILTNFEEFAKDNKTVPELKDLVGNIKVSFSDYQKLIEETKTINLKIDEGRNRMNTAASDFMVNANAYLQSQTAKFYEENNKNSGAKALADRVDKITMINNVIDYGNSVRLANFKGQALREIKDIEASLAIFTKIEEEIKKLQAVTKQEANLQQLDKISASGEAYKKEMEEFIGLWNSRLAIEQTRNNKRDELNDNADKIQNLGIENTKKIAKSTNTSLSASTVVMIIGLTIAVILGIALSIIIITSITKSINQIVNNLKTGAEQVFQASEQLSSASQSLAEGSSEQAAAIEETSSTLDETSSMVQQNTENTKQASALSNSAKESADKGNKEMEEMMKAMSEIKESSSQISKIIKVIDDIAFQTNILALNAAVEAAGAGEAGMGFAVVAEEVRNLAQRSAQAAKDTSDMIETSIIRANKGADIAERVFKSLEEIKGQAKKVNEIMNEITTASQEQAQGIFQINKAVNQMEQVTQSIASGAEESASSSEELSAQAESLMEIVNNLIVLVEGEGAVKNHYTKRIYKTDTRAEKSRVSNTRVNRVHNKKESHEFSPETIIPLNEDSIDF